MQQRCLPDLLPRQALSFRAGIKLQRSKIQKAALFPVRPREVPFPENQTVTIGTALTHRANRHQANWIDSEGCSIIFPARIDPRGNSDSLDTGSPPFDWLVTSAMLGYSQKLSSIFFTDRPDADETGFLTSRSPSL
jgi:hypothetical protein